MSCHDTAQEEDGFYIQEVNTFWCKMCTQPQDKSKRPYEDAGKKLVKRPKSEYTVRTVSTGVVASQCGGVLLQEVLEHFTK